MISLIMHACAHAESLFKYVIETTAINKSKLLGKSMKIKEVDYLEQRFQKEGMVWGNKPSVTVDIAVEYFKEFNVHSVLVLGSGYGRNAEALAKKGFQVSGIEISKTALKIAEKSNKENKCGIDYKLGSVLEMSYPRESFDGAYCFNVLHLFQKESRKKFLEAVYRILKLESIVFFTVFSEKEPSFGKGVQIEPNMFEGKKGRPIYYFTKQDLDNHFKKYEILDNKLIEEPENHGGGPHTHILRIIIARKK